MHSFIIAALLGMSVVVLVLNQEHRQQLPDSIQF
jgi:hypothetical protein